MLNTQLSQLIGPCKASISNLVKILANILAIEWVFLMYTSNFVVDYFLTGEFKPPID